jgi:hypothetical protein
MANLTRSFVLGRMNKVVDERLVPNGEYIDALNIRMGSTELSELGVIENAIGNDQITTLEYGGSPLSSDAVCIGAYEDGARETIYWFVHDSNNPVSSTAILDMIVSYNTISSAVTYHILSEQDISGFGTTLNFNPKHLMNGINLVDDLLFFTDDYNPPRFININKSYPVPVLGVDQITAEEIQVVKKPPTQAPTVVPIVSASNDNFMKDRFICFAYRYRYEENQYSATSQFSQPAFIPGQFQFTPDSFLNGGMQNLATNAIITVETGSSLVKGIDILFKEASGNIIKVIVKLDKAAMGIADNTTYTDSEILRLYDNVPLLAKAQTVMGNRLVYGNYVEGYDMVDSFGLPVNIEYTTELISEDIETQVLNGFTSTGAYSWDIPLVINDASLRLDLTPIASDLKEGANLTIEFSLTHAAFSNGTLPEETLDVQLTFSYTLPQDFINVGAMINSVSFRNAIGTQFNIETLQNCSVGDTLTDRFNCAVPQNLDTYTKYESGVSAANQPIVVGNPFAPNELFIYFPAVSYVDNIITPTNTVYEYYKVQEFEATFQNISNIKSLHSNRGYEVGIVYMDEFGRSSTPFVSNQNTVFVPCGNSPLRNSIRVEIPVSQRAPYWAKRYKFFIKQDLDTYETIYSNIFFDDPNNDSVWFLLDGENAKKVQEGDRLIVKSDTSGPVQNCVYATILEKAVKPQNFLYSTPLPPGVPFIPGGVYVRMLPNNFNTIKDDNAYVDLGFKSTSCENDFYPLMVYPVSYADGSPIDIPAGSRVRFYINFYRRGTGSGDRKCERRSYTLEKFLVSSNSYSDFKDFFVGEGVASVLNDGFQDNGDNSCNINNIFNQSIGAFPTPTGSCCNYNLSGCALNTYVSNCTAEYKFNQDPNPNGLLTLLVSGGVWACGDSWKREAKISMHIEIVRATDLIVFETQPVDTLPDIFYESSETFDIVDIGGNPGQHQGNVQSQNFSLNSPAIIDTDFFNCYSFGNGVESYKILDSAAGKHFNIGNRVTATSSKDYMEVDRYADLTYSGIYNDESNVNKLNEFNLGLLNFKPLENYFGSIEKLFARETDILVLQEDKISYVLAGKNLLSDAAAGSAITSVPEVLGTQIARLENYGISKNPESFASYGYDKYFTDSKRGAVLKLSGSSYSNDQLEVISELGMRTWFRDLFINNNNTQKLGGYDPYMNEYVIGANDKDLPVDDGCVACNTIKNLQLTAPNPGVMTLASTLCIDYGRLTGDVTIDITYSSPTNQIVVESVYNTNTFTTGPITSNDTLIFLKDSVTETKGYIYVYVEADSNVILNISCPGANEMNLIRVCVSNTSNAGKYIHTEYNYNNAPYISPMVSTIVAMSSSTLNPIVSLYSLYSGSQGDAFIPVDGSLITMRSNKIGFDDLQFDPSADRFMWLRTNVLYQNTPTDISNLLAAAFTATPINTTNAPNLYFTNFTMPVAPGDDYLYLIWDYRSGTMASLCYDLGSSFDACCGCTCGEPCESYIIEAVLGPVTFSYNKCDSLIPTTINLNTGESVTICVDSATFSFSSPDATIQKLNCGCTNDLPKPTSFSSLGLFYTGYTEPYQQYVSYSTNPVFDSICQTQSPLASSTVYSTIPLYVVTGVLTPAIGVQLYSDTSGTPSTFSGIVIFNPTPNTLPSNIFFVATVLYINNGVITGTLPVIDPGNYNC